MKDTRDNILDAAEELFAANGVNAVSARQINAAAGVSSSILHYHFGGRDQVVEALLERRLPAIAAERRAMLKALQSGVQKPTVRQLLEVIVLPLANLVQNEGESGRRYLQLLSRLSTERNPIYHKIAYKYTTGLRSKVLNELIACLPNVNPAIVEFRIAMAANIVFNTLGDPNELSRPWQKQLAKHDLELPQLVDALMDFVCGGMQFDDSVQPAPGT